MASEKIASLFENWLPHNKPEFDSMLGKVHQAYHRFGIDKMSTKHAWEVNTERTALGQPHDRLYAV